MALLLAVAGAQTTAQVSWLQVATPVLVAGSSVTDGQDALSASAVATPPVTAQVSWLQVAANQLTASLTDTDAADALVSASTAIAVVRAVVSWLQGQAPAGPTAYLSVTEAQDTLSSSAAATPVITAIVSWLQVAVSSGPIASLAATEASDSLLALVSISDPQVAGAWTPALRTRWLVLDYSTSKLTATEGSDVLSAMAQALLVANSSVTDAPEGFVSSAFGQALAALFSAVEAPDVLDSTVWSSLVAAFRSPNVVYSTAVTNVVRSTAVTNVVVAPLDDPDVAASAEDYNVSATS